MEVSCRFHVVCAPFSALATRKSANAKADSSGIQPLLNFYFMYNQDEDLLHIFLYSFSKFHNTKNKQYVLKI